MNDNIIPDYKYKGLRPQYIEKCGRLWLSKGHLIFYSDDQGATFLFAGKGKQSCYQLAGKSCRILARLLRTGFKTLIPIDDGTLIGVMQKKILKITKNSNKFKEVYSFKNGSGPLNICKDPKGDLYFGEYFNNPDRNEVRIISSKDNGKTWHVAYTFGKGEIRHIHGIYYDKYRDGYWVLTGDEDLESKICFTRNRFKSLDVIYEGSQQFRATSITIFEKYLIIATDSPVEQNHIYKLVPETREVEKIQALSGSVLYSTQVGEFIVLSVSAEASRVNKNKVASIMFSKNINNWKTLYCQKRDFLQLSYGKLPHVFYRPYFQHGAFVIPHHSHNNDAIFYTYGQALTPDDDCMLVWNLDDAWAKISKRK